ncbi:Fic/DOC family protein [Pseudoalteromonas luteoviolacea]|uniref:Fic/DOC family protein n=1 Tax=Pseudoalteromonas luteoviolacea TaxID=43657 RepID=UPI0011545015|nr:Fic family protein [Pseudoalteromonas luteoviolacea]TQF71265.1 cell filamentation protein Fic [Pseudoalteromonas luteoviolacea]
MSKYDVESAEGSYQPGSDDKVLLNKQQIINEEEMESLETELLLRLYEVVFEDYWPFEVLIFDDIATWHRKWLGNVYEWAGRNRTVTLGKEGFSFAAPNQISTLTQKFESKYLIQFASLHDKSRTELVSYLAESHVEFILAHPFREGNGRISRLLLDVMASQAGYSPFDYTLWDENKEYYFKSIQAGVAGNYSYLERLVNDTLQTNLQG